MSDQRAEAPAVLFSRPWSESASVKYGHNQARLFQLSGLRPVSP